jgi:hypothetical protein
MAISSALLRLWPRPRHRRFRRGWREPARSNPPRRGLRRGGEKKKKKKKKKEEEEEKKNAAGEGVCGRQVE